MAASGFITDELLSVVSSASCGLVQCVPTRVDVDLFARVCAAPVVLHRRRALLQPPDRRTVRHFDGLRALDSMHLT